MSEELKKTLTTLKRCVSRVQSRDRICLGRKLIELEAQTDLWVGVYPRFQTLIRDNRLCDWDVYRRFKTAEKTLGSDLVNQLGYWAATRVVEAPSNQRKRIATRLHRWMSLQSMHPSYQAIDDWLEHAYPTLFKAEPKVSSLLSRLREELAFYKKAYEDLVKKHERYKRRYPATH